MKRIMRKIQPSSSLHLPPTPAQVRAIAKLAQRLGIIEPVENSPANRKEAQAMIAGFLTESRKRGIR